MRRQTLLLLTTMVVAVALASGTAMAAESQLDQQQTSSDWAIHVTSRGAYQTFTAAKTGTLDKVSLYIGCCGTEGAPTSPLRVAVGNAVVMLPASSFTNDGSLEWVDVPFSPAPTVEAGQQYSISLQTWGDGPNYLWGYNSGGGYSGGELNICFRVDFGDGTGFTQCQVFKSPLGAGASADAAFKTYVTDAIPPQTIIHPNLGPSGTVSDTYAAFWFYTFENGSTFECRLDSSSEDDWVECTSPQEYFSLPEGQHTFEVRATDSSGNTDPTPASRTWTVDIPDPPPPLPVIPHVTETNPGNGVTGVPTSITPTVTFDTDLDEATVNPENVRLQVYKAKKKKWVTVSSTPSYEDRVITVTPDNALGSRKKYRVVLSTNIESSTDSKLEQPFSFRFATGRVG